MTQPSNLASSLESTQQPAKPDPPAASGLSYGTITIVVLSFVLGYVTAELVNNGRAGEQVAFSTPSLLGFLFGVALSAASIILAVAAIALGKSSEQAIVRRTDESIRLQNEVFVRTTDALARIESSTGLTERRIEDIISGRAGDLSHSIAERIASSGGSKSTSRETLEREIRESLIQEFSVTRAKERQAELQDRQNALEAGRRKYQEFQGALLAELANSGVGRCEKLGSGNFGESGQHLVDAIVSVGQKKVAVAGLSATQPFAQAHLKNFPKFLESLAGEIHRGSFDVAVIAFDSQLRDDGNYRTAFRSATAIMQPELADALVLIDGPDGSAVGRVTEYLKRLHDEPRGPQRVPSSAA